MSSQMILLKHIYKKYGNGDATVHALSNLSLNIDKGEMVAIMGRSGSGKSTLLNILGGLTKIDHGEYYFNGIRLDLARQSEVSTFRRKHIGFIVQHYALLHDRTIFENIELPLLYCRMPKEERRDRVMKVLKDVGLEDKYKRYPNELSGGQCQRAAIARALVNDADVLLADEPTGALDVRTESEIMAILQRLHDEGKTIVIVTHDTKIANGCDRIIHIEDGQVVSLTS